MCVDHRHYRRGHTSYLADRARILGESDYSVELWPGRRLRDNVLYETTIRNNHEQVGDRAASVCVRARRIGPGYDCRSVLDSNTVFVQSALMAFSMGVQNGAAMVLIPNCPPTTAMTGNTVRFYIYGAEALNFWLASHNYVELYPAKTGKPDGYDQKMQKNSRELALKFRIFLASLGPFTVGAVFGVPCAYAMGMACLVFPILIVVWVLYCISKGLEAERVEEIAKNGEKEGEVTQSPLYAAVDNVDTESGKLSERTGLGHHSEGASGVTGQAGVGSEQDSGAGLSHVRSYQLIYDDAYDGEEVTSDQLHKL
jgi:hypothetical protein